MKITTPISWTATFNLLTFSSPSAPTSILSTTTTTSLIPYNLFFIASLYRQIWASEFFLEKRGTPRRVKRKLSTFAPYLFQGLETFRMDFDKVVIVNCSSISNDHLVMQADMSTVRWVGDDLVPKIFGSGVISPPVVPKSSFYPVLVQKICPPRCGENVSSPPTILG